MQPCPEQRVGRAQPDRAFQRKSARFCLPIPPEHGAVPPVRPCEIRIQIKSRLQLAPAVLWTTGEYETKAKRQVTRRFFRIGRYRLRTPLDACRNKLLARNGTVQPSVEQVRECQSGIC